MIICVTGLSQKERSKIQEKTKQLSIGYSGPFTDKVTHLIAHNLLSEKAQVAIKHKIPVLEQEWLLKAQNIEDLVSFEKYRLKPLQGLHIATSDPEKKKWVQKHGGRTSDTPISETTHFLDSNDTLETLETIVKEYQPLLEHLDGLKIYLGSGFDTTLVQFLRKSIRQAGGHFCSTLDSTTTHYIASKQQLSPSDLNTLKKLQHLPKIVHYEWLSKCHKSGKKLDTTPFEIDLEPQKPKKKRVFDGIGFTVRGFDEQETQVLERNIVKHGGHLGGEQIICPFQSRSGEGLTEFWIEKCLLRQERVEPDKFLYKPTIHSLPLEQFRHHKISITGYSPEDRSWMARLITLMGARYSDSFSRENTHLIADNTTSQKAEKAIEWGIPLVSDLWLLKCCENGYQVDLKAFTLAGSNNRLSKRTKLSLVSQPEKRPFMELNLERKEKSDFDLKLANAIKSAASSQPTEVELTQDRVETIETTILVNDMIKDIQTNLESFQEPTKKRIKRSQQSIYEPEQKSNDCVQFVDQIGQLEKTRLFKQDQFKILFSGFTNSERHLLVTLCEKLGAQIQNKWEDTTHLIVSRPSTTEKYLAGCAQGLWVMRPDWIHESASQSKWIKEEDYEWQGEGIAAAPRFWRTSARKPFEGVKLYMDLDKKKRESFEHILLCGGAQFVPKDEAQWIQQDH
ncbi:BRCT domain-containing protein [Gorgonomyces haynaldii]|nr:BRCT domain-containing protein [Gorgonomyces haynaldii]